MAWARQPSPLRRITHLVLLAQLIEPALEVVGPQLVVQTLLLGQTIPLRLTLGLHPHPRVVAGLDQLLLALLLELLLVERVVRHVDERERRRRLLLLHHARVFVPRPLEQLLVPRQGRIERRVRVEALGRQALRIRRIVHAALGLQLGEAFDLLLALTELATRQRGCRARDRTFSSRILACCSIKRWVASRRR